MAQEFCHICKEGGKDALKQIQKEKYFLKCIMSSALNAVDLWYHNIDSKNKIQK
jgi:hypothetical protein